MVYIRAVSTIYSSHIQFFSTCPFILYLCVLSNNLKKDKRVFCDVLFLVMFLLETYSISSNDFTSLLANLWAVGQIDGNLVHDW